MKKQFLLGSLFLIGFIFCTQRSFSQVKIGDNIEQISPYALLELESSEKGFILPRMTTAARDLAFNQDTPAGMMIFNTDENKMQFFREETDPRGRKTGYKVWEGPRAGVDLINSGESQPLAPVLGQLYFDTSTNTLYLWDGSQWLNIMASALDQTATSAPQSLTLNQTILSISEGNSVDLSDLALVGATGPIGPQGPQGSQGPQGIPGSTTNTDSQTLTATALSTTNSITLSISGGNSVDLDLSGLAGSGSGTDSQTLAYVNATATATQTAISLGNSQSLTLITSGTLTLSNTDSTTLTLTATGNSGTDSQTLAYVNATATATQTAISLGNSQSLTLITSGTLTLSNTDSTTLTLTATGNSGTDSQTLAYVNATATATQTAISLGNSQSLTLITSGTLTLSNTDSTTLTLTATGNSGTDSQTLAYVNATATATQTAISLGNSQSLTLITSGTLSLSNTDSTTLTLTAGAGDQIIDADGDTQIQVEEGTDDDAIRFDTGGTQRAVITAAGNMGIGTTTPNAPLQLARAVANRKIVLYQYYNNDHQFYGFGVNAGVLRYQVESTSADHVFYTAVNTSSSNELMRIKGTGNVGIGTSSPSEKLEVNGTIKATDINFTGLPEYADEAAATTGGLSTGDLYKTATGEIRIKL